MAEHLAIMALCWAFWASVVFPNYSDVFDVCDFPQVIQCDRAFWKVHNVDRLVEEGVLEHHLFDIKRGQAKFDETGFDFVDVVKYWQALQHIFQRFVVEIVGVVV